MTECAARNAQKVKRVSLSERRAMVENQSDQPTMPWFINLTEDEPWTYNIAESPGDTMPKSVAIVRWLRDELGLGGHSKLLRVTGDGVLRRNDSVLFPSR